MKPLLSPEPSGTDPKLGSVSPITITRPLPKVFVYDLPPKFNTEIAVHPSYQGTGMGKPLWEGQEVYRDTDQWALEVIIHHYFLNYPGRVTDPARADFFYVPFCVGINARRNWPERVDQTRRLENELLELLGHKYPYWKRYGPRRHVMTLSRNEFEFLGGRSHFLLHPMARKVTLLTVESCYYMFNLVHSLTVPFPSWIHSVSGETPPWEEQNERRYLACFLGNPILHGRKRPAIRKVLFEELERHPNCVAKGVKPGDCADYKKAILAMKSSVFSLQPPGDVHSSSRKAFFDSILLGCIPVFFHDTMEFPFDRWIPYQDFCVYVDPRKLTSRHTVVDILERISQDQISAMQNKLRQWAPYLQYPFSKDDRSSPLDSPSAFDLILPALAELTCLYRGNVNLSNQARNR